MALVKTLILPALLLFQPHPAAAGPAVPAETRGAETRLTDAQAEALARTAINANDPKVQAEALLRLQVHHFKSSLAPERELVLGVQGLLEDRLGKAPQAAATFHKLEQAWPRSPYLAEGVLALGLVPALALAVFAAGAVLAAGAALGAGAGLDRVLTLPRSSATVAAQLSN